MVLMVGQCGDLLTIVLIFSVREEAEKGGSS